jgi:hypothetical protein
MNVRKKNAIIFMAIATCSWVIYKLVWNVKKIISIPSDILCHTQELLTLTEVVEYFKNQPMQPDEDTPFIVSDWNKIFSKEDISKYRKEGYEAIFMGVYSYNQTIRHYQIVYAKQVDLQLREVLAKAIDGIVVLK